MRLSELVEQARRLLAG